MSRYRIFNLNSKVWFQPNERTLGFLERRGEDDTRFYQECKDALKTDPVGWVGVQMHELMHVFGTDLHHFNVALEMNVLFEERDVPEAPKPFLLPKRKGGGE